MELIETDRLRLIPADAELLLLELKDPEKFAEKIGAETPKDWPPEILTDALPYFAQMAEEHPEDKGWFAWYWLCKENGDLRLAGSGGFKGPPDENGIVETGYSIIPAFQGKGYATEGLSALVKWAFSHENVRMIIAETLSDNYPSIRVLEKNGFKNCGCGSAEMLLRFELSK